MIINYFLQANNVLNSIGKHLSPNYKIQGMNEFSYFKD